MLAVSAGTLALLQLRLGESLLPFSYLPASTGRIIVGALQGRCDKLGAQAGSSMS